MSQSRTYRGRVISLEGRIHPMGGGSIVKLHRLAKVNRADVILPRKKLCARPQCSVRDQLKALHFEQPACAAA